MDQTATIGRFRAFLSGPMFYLIVSCTSCMDSQPLYVFTVTESSGIARELEYIEVGILLQGPLDSEQALSIREKDQSDLIEGQFLGLAKQTNGKHILQYLFPISLGANQTKVFEVVSRKGTSQLEHLKIEGTDLNLKVENAYFIADLTNVKASSGNGLGSGQLAGLQLKQFDNQLLERTHINMHWSPNFQREGLDYKTFGHMKDDSVRIEQGPYRLSIFRSGYVPGYEAIRLNVEYQFYAGLPYFFFTSEMIAEDSVELILLRNDEMTMDSLFTHVVFPRPNGEILSVPMYDGYSVDSLAKDPIQDEVDWLYFYNEHENYAFGSIRLNYDTKNMDGGSSALYGEHTKISKASGGGRYWNRRLVHDHKTLVPKGSRYFEENAYIVFRSDLEDPGAEIEQSFKRLTSPLRVEP